MQDRWEIPRWKESGEVRGTGSQGFEDDLVLCPGHTDGGRRVVCVSAVGRADGPEEGGQFFLPAGLGLRRQPSPVEGG